LGLPISHGGGMRPKRGRRQSRLLQFEPVAGSVFCDPVSKATRATILLNHSKSVALTVWPGRRGRRESGASVRPPVMYRLCPDPSGCPVDLAARPPHPCAHKHQRTRAGTCYALSTHQPRRTSLLIRSKLPPIVSARRPRLILGCGWSW